MNFKSFVAGVLFLFSSSIASQSAFYHIEQQNSESIVIDFDFPKPEIVESQSTSSLVSVDIPGLPLNYAEGQPLIPVFSSSLVVPEGNVSWTLISAETEIIKDAKPVLYYSGDNSAMVNASRDYTAFLYPSQIIYLDEAGIFRDYRMMGLRVYPLQVLPDGIKYYKSLKIKIRFSGTQYPSTVSAKTEHILFDKIALNGSQVSSISPAITPKSQMLSKAVNLSASGSGVKIFVNRKGIYRITGQDFLDAGIDVESINPKTFHLKNRGNDVAIFVSGDQDLQFDPGDYIEFWGEKNEKTFLKKYPDIYSDPFSDENVYTLRWGGTPGLRMVEESGAIVETNPARYNPARFYPYTVHFEQDNFFERMGYGNTHKLSYTRDLWFFDSGIQAVSKKSYKVNLIYPDSSSFNPVKVTMKFCGRSEGAHNLMAWLNQKLVGQVNSGWYGQDTVTISNNLSTDIRPADLANGENDFEILMPSLPAGSEADHVLFNWADITYDRHYWADNNAIEFGRPSPSVIYYPDISLYQFEIDNFSRQDIEVYKKGISKIVNYKLEVQGSGSSKKYRITFQDNVFSDDVEYMAVTNNLKLKPLRIEKDEPYDPEKPALTLKDPSNSADYIIITHQKFYDRAKQLADFHRQQGMNVALVNVQNIYDEFNYGIKSPLAIQDFLKYAFYNWDRSHRLKYVLLFGDANYNYKASSELAEDYVPTFFYQTRKFGAVATDLPYALVAGDDEIPDLFVGRIPVMTLGEATNSIEKIIEYEQNPVAGPWRNQSLFISGNDKSTYELNGIFGIPKKHAFRTQNQRIIDLLLPRNFTAFKLNTVKDENLQYDPNFGGTTDLIEYFDNGTNFMTFLGHGGGAIWADVQLLNLQDIDRLNNKGKYPFIASMTCFTGAFDNPGFAGLAQKMVVAREKGAIGVFASSGLGWVANDYAMLWDLSKNLFQPNTSLGEAVTLGKIDYYITSQYVIYDTLVPGSYWQHEDLKHDMVHQYNLIGDPAVTMKIPQGKLDLQVDNQLPQPGDTIQVKITAPFTNAEGYLELANGKDEVVSRLPLYYSDSESAQSLNIPSDFAKGPGYVRAYLEENGDDAAGLVQIGVNYSVFDSVQTIPAQPNAEDSVALQFAVKDDLGISQVKVVAVLPVVGATGDTLHMQTSRTGTNTFRTIGKIPPTYSLSTVYYFVYATNSDGNTSRMNFSYKVQETRPDPFIYHNKIRLVGGDKVRLGVPVGNLGEVAAEGVLLKVYNGNQNYAADQAFAQQAVSVDGKDSMTVKLDFPFDLNVSSYKIYAALDPQKLLPDFNRGNNLDSSSIQVNMFNLVPELGSTYKNVSNDTIKMGDFQFWLGAGEITGSAAVSYEINDITTSLQQAGLTPVLLRNLDKPVGLMLTKFNDEAKLTSPFLLNLQLSNTHYDSTTSAEKLPKLYRWDERMQVWLQQDAVLDTFCGCLTARLQETGFYAPFISSDNQPPRIELTVDGRQIRSKSLVSPNPVLNIVFEDESGLNIDRNRIRVMVDDAVLPQEKIFIPDSVQQSKVMGITAYPDLDIGQHSLQIDVKDVNGNESTKNYSLKVDDAFDLKVFGNYPNPFSDETIFSYYITSRDIIDDLEIRIFTTSGRLIKRIKNDMNTITPGNDPRRVGYNELIWDGTDEDGNQVANGVYFALVRAKYEGKERQEILKVAKLK